MDVSLVYAKKKKNGVKKSFFVKHLMKTHCNSKIPSRGGKFYKNRMMLNG